jgi:hypothetical protein
MLQASYDFRDCLRTVNEDTVYNDQVGEEDQPGGAHRAPGQRIVEMNALLGGVSAPVSLQIVLTAQ